MCGANSPEPGAVPRRRTVFLTAARVIGTAPHHLNSAIALGRAGRQLRVVAPADPPGRFEPSSIVAALLPEGSLRLVPRTRRLGSRLTWYVRCHRTARRALRELDANELFVYGSQVALVALLLRPFLRRGTQIIYHTQDFLEPWRHPLRAWLEALVCRCADQVIINEPNRGRALQSIYALAEAPLVVPTGLLTDWPIPERSQSRRAWLMTQAPKPPADGKEPILIVHQGPLRTNRCGLELLAALATLPRHYLLVVTGMERDELDVMASYIGQSLIGRIILPGKMEFQEMLDVTASCDLGVLLYPNDGIGNYYQAPGRLSENCRSSIPSIASAFPPFEQIACHADFIALCDPTDPHDIARAAQRLGDLTPAVRAQLGKAAQCFALKALAFERNMAAVLGESEHA